MKSLPFSHIRPVPLRQVRPAGWLKEFLVRQANGLTGNVEVCGYPYGYEFWGSKEEDIKGSYGTWWPYEQTGYWIDGALRCGYLTGDEDLYQDALQEVDFAIKNASADGFIGPKSMRTKDRWPHAVFFRAVLAQYEISGDSGYLDAMIRHYRALPHPMDWDRDVTGVEILLQLYEQRRDADLLEMAQDLYRRFNEKFPRHDCATGTMLSEAAPTEHGVTFNEIAKLAPLLYCATGNEVHLDAAMHAYDKLDRKALLADGLHSCSEHIRGKTSRDMHETCDLSDYTWALGYLLQATGEVRYADRIEEVIFNALPGSVTKDFHALQYFSCPNQVITTSTSNHNLFMRGLNWMSYRPDHEVQCCPGNVHRAMPNYLSRMWMRSTGVGPIPGGGVVAAFYGPGSLTTTVGEKDTPVKVEAATRYPFEEAITFSFEPEEEVCFPFSVRIPGWCQAAKVSINGQSVQANLEGGAFFTVERCWQAGDSLRLDLPFQPRVMYWPRGGVSLHYGPLTMALPVPIKAEVETENTTIQQRMDTLGESYIPRSLVEEKEFPAWNLYPDGPWNYALCLDEKSLPDLEVVWDQDGDYPLDPDKPALQMKVKARRVKRWHLVHRRKARQFGHWTEDGTFCWGLRTIHGDFWFTPPLPEPESLDGRLGDEVEELILVPYAGTMLRVTVFPCTEL